MNRNHATRGFLFGVKHINSDAGWQDFRAGLPFPKEYDSWPRSYQRNYENGRLRAANYLLAKGRIPARQPVSTAHIVMMVGPAIPPQRIVG